MTTPKRTPSKRLLPRLYSWSSCLAVVFMWGAADAAIVLTGGMLTTVEEETKARVRLTREVIALGQPSSRSTGNPRRTTGSAVCLPPHESDGASARRSAQPRVKTEHELRQGLGAPLLL